MATEQVRWRELRTNDVIICPSSGLEESVTFNRPYVKGRRVVRTSRHDHYRPADEKVARRLKA